MADLSVYLVPAIALLAAAIAWAQWHTARSKLVLDLFNQRMEVYEGVCAVMRKVMREGTATTQDVVDLAGPQDRAGFLFGDDVNAYLKSLQKALAQLGYCRSIISQLKGDEEYQKAVGFENLVMSKTVATFYDDFGRLLMPYMRMHHKKPMWRLRARPIFTVWIKSVYPRP